MALTRVGARVFEEAGYSLLGPLALNIAAPDDANMHMLEAIATSEQNERYLRPFATGVVRSCFAMTEPAPNAGPDPSALSTWPSGSRAAGGSTATSGSSPGWRVPGARRGDRGGAMMFLVDADNPGMKTVRHIETLDESLFRGHIELPLHDCFVPYDAVRCAVDEGFVCTHHRQRLPLGSEFETVGETPAPLVAAGLCALRRKS